MARECIVHPARGSLESAETFISEARGGALSFPGFNGEDSWSSWGKMKLYLMFFLQLLKMVRTERDGNPCVSTHFLLIWSCCAVVIV